VTTIEYNGWARIWWVHLILPSGRQYFTPPKLETTFERRHRDQERLAPGFRGPGRYQFARLLQINLILSKLP
jgi:hypothetical protein